jgi:hypothetical protein
MSNHDDETDPFLQGSEEDVHQVRAYRTRDLRLRCRGCRRWMRFGEPTAKTPATRQKAPNANFCIACHTSGAHGAAT